MGNYKIYRRGKLSADKVTYKDGVGCCVWYLWPDPESPDEEDMGMCFDFSAEDLDDFIALLQDLKEATPDIYKDTSGDNDVR